MYAFAVSQFLKTSNICTYIICTILTFDVVIESYNALDGKIDSVRDELKQDISLLDFKIETVNNHLSKKIDAAAGDLKAHRADTEAHGNIYRVKES